MEEEWPRLVGEVTRVEFSGFGILRSRTDKLLYAFLFQDIDGYKGERPKELGLEVGKSVEFELGEDGLVSKVWI
jgi:hypothetical protein